MKGAAGPEERAVCSLQLVLDVFPSCVQPLDAMLLSFLPAGGAGDELELGWERSVRWQRPRSGGRTKTGSECAGFCQTAAPGRGGGEEGGEERPNPHFGRICHRTGHEASPWQNLREEGFWWAGLGARRCRDWGQDYAVPRGPHRPPPRLSCDSDSALRELQPAADFWGIFASPVGETFLALAALRACCCRPLLSSEAGESGPGVEEEGAGWCGEDEGGPGTRGGRMQPLPTLHHVPSPWGSGSCCPGLPVAPGGITSTPAPFITRCTLGSPRAFGVAASVLIPEL